jgi:hypothetical protein
MNLDPVEIFMRGYPHFFVIAAHSGGIAIAIWLGRWDLLIAGIAFGIPSTMLFYDLLPGGGNRTVKLLRSFIRP